MGHRLQVEFEAEKEPGVIWVRKALFLLLEKQSAQLEINWGAFD